MSIRHQMSEVDLVVKLQYYCSDLEYAALLKDNRQMISSSGLASEKECMCSCYFSVGGI